MLSTKEPRIMWAWVCPVTGMVLDEAWGATEAYATRKTVSYFGKRRSECGDMRPVKVTIEPLSDAETIAYRAEYAAWAARKDAERAAASMAGEKS